MRRYEETHKWISFGIDLRHAPAELWIHLGEAASKCEHLSWVPLLPSTAKKLHEIYLAKGVAGTTAIEGNTLSEAEILEAVEGKLQVPPSKEYLKQEVTNIIGVCNDICGQVAAGSLPEVTPELISSYNLKVLKDLEFGESVLAGEVRRHSVVVGNVYRGAPPKDCPYLLGKLCDWLNGPDFKPAEGLETVYAILRAVVSHIYLAWIHPYGDGNGRTARLVEFHTLLGAGVPSPAAHLLSNHYNATRTEYYRQLDLASKTGGDITAFLRYAAAGLVDGLRAQIKYLMSQQLDLVWRDHVHDCLRGKPGPSHDRRRNLAQELGRQDRWVQTAEVPELSMRLAKAYANRTSKTISRDVNELAQLGLVERDGRKVRARREAVFALLPIRKQTPRTL